MIEDTKSPDIALNAEIRTDITLLFDGFCSDSLDLVNSYVDNLSPPCGNANIELTAKPRPNWRIIDKVNTGFEDD